MSKTRTLRIGIASFEQMQARTIAIARGEYKPRSDEPKVWFTSIESLAQVLSTRNKLLLEIIAKAEPASLTELALLSKRQTSNLSRTLKTMQQFKLVELTKDAQGHVVPRVAYDRLVFDLQIAHAPKAAQLSTL